MSRIHHINLVVSDLELTTTHFEMLTGVRARPIETLPQRHVALRRLRMNGLWLVLLAPTDASSPAAEWLEKRGPGLFLLSFSADSLDAELARLQTEGITPSSEQRAGLDDWRVVDLDPVAFGGIRVQITESAENKGLESESNE
ncbi:MAG: VOC family protein [Pseudomonadota bacterium]